MGCRCQEKHSRILSLRIRQARSTCRAAILLRPPRPLPVDLRSRQAPRAATVGTDIANLPPYGNGTLPPGIRSRPIANVNGLTVRRSLDAPRYQGAIVRQYACANLRGDER